MDDFGLPISYVNAVDMPAVPLEGGSLNDILEKVRSPAVMRILMGLVVAGIIGWVIFIVVTRLTKKKDSATVTDTVTVGENEPSTVVIEPSRASQAQFSRPSAFVRVPKADAAVPAQPADASAVPAAGAVEPAAAASESASDVLAEKVPVPAEASADAPVEAPVEAPVVAPVEAPAAAPAVAPEAAEAAGPTLKTMRAGRRGRAAKSEVTLSLFSRKPDELDAAPAVKPGAAEAAEAETSHDVMMRNYSFDKFREAMMSGSAKSILLGEEEEDAHWRATGHTRAAYERHEQPMRGAFDAEEA